MCHDQVTLKLPPMPILTWINKLGRGRCLFRPSTRLWGASANLCGASRVLPQGVPRAALACKFVKAGLMLGGAAAGRRPIAPAEAARPFRSEESGPMPRFEVSLLCLAALVFFGQVDLPGAEGDFGVRAGHAPIVTMLRPGLVRVVANGSGSKFVVLGGLAQFSQSTLNILADTATPINEFDAAELKPRSRRWRGTCRQ
jgi:F-type H+-transporting ATPase subunit epsilon